MVPSQIVGARSLYPFLSSLVSQYDPAYRFCFSFPCSPCFTVLPIAMALPSSYFLPGHPINPAMMVTDATRWVFQRVKKLVRPLRTSSGLGAFALPPEIILMITSYLSNSSTISLALTCRPLYSLCFPEDPLLDMAEKEELLLLLEKDVATLYFCHDCVKLHRCHSRWSRFLTPWYNERMPCKESIHNVLFFPQTRPIPYYQARLVMNRHLYGPTHGPPLHKLGARTRSYCLSDGFVRSSSQHARIVDDQLLVLSVESMSHSRGDSTELRSCIDSFPNPLCAHLTLSEGSPNYAPMQLPELAKDETAPNLFTPCVRSFGSCPFCSTDYSIDISWQGERQGYVVQVFVYCQLGDCRSPSDWNRSTISILQPEEEPRTAYSVERTPGLIRDRWNKADGITSMAHGRWVACPGWFGERRCVA